MCIPNFTAKEHIKIIKKSNFLCLFSCMQCPKKTTLCSVPHTYAIGTYRVRTYAQQVHIFIVQSYQIILIQQNNLRKILTEDVKNIYFSFIISLQKILVNYCATTYLFLFCTPIAHRYTPFSPSQAPLFYHRTAVCLYI